MTITRRHHIPAALVLLLALAAPARAQYAQPLPEVNMAGPRFGVTMLSQKTIDTLKEHDVVLRPLVSQFGWQFEKRVYTSKEGTAMLSEWVPLITGLEQGVALPSLNWLVGLRTPTGKVIIAITNPPR